MGRMCRAVGFTFLALALGPGAAFAQADPMGSGPPGTPITPPQIGSWVFTPGLSAEQAAADARAEGYGGIQGLHEDLYGDWIGESGRGAFIVFPNGHTYPL